MCVEVIVCYIIVVFFRHGVARRCLAATGTHVPYRITHYTVLPATRKGGNVISAGIPACTPAN